MDLPDTGPEHMRIWIKFLYTGRIFTGTETPQIRQSEAELFCKDVSAWNRLYTLGDFLQDGDFKDALIDAMMEFTAILNAYPIRLPDFIYSHSTKDSAHRRFVVDMFVNVRNDKTFETNLGYSQEFLYDMLKSIVPSLGKGIELQFSEDWFKSQDGCKYHDHGDKPCYKKKPAFRF